MAMLHRLAMLQLCRAFCPEGSAPLVSALSQFCRGAVGRCSSAVHLSRPRRLLTTEVKRLARRREIEVHDGMTVTELAGRLKTSHGSVLKVLRDAGERVKGRNPVLALDLSELVVEEMGHTPCLPRVKAVYATPRVPSSLKPRPPVVVVMGHVDHGKTTLLDSLRKTSVAAREAGGITQHIGAFSVCLGSGHQITFLDTPGHAAFSAMRARGANVTDIVVLVVAADDGVMAQTKESIKLVQQASVPVVVAINKCDRPRVDTGRVKVELLQCGVQLEEFGGEVQAVEISALKGTGLGALEEAIVAQAEQCDVSGDPGGLVEGTVIETSVDRGLGPVATVIVRHGTLRCGDVLAAGNTWGKVRAMLNDQKRPLQCATPSMPVLTVGWRDVPIAGEECLQVESEQCARVVCEYRAALQRRRAQRVHWEAKQGVPVVVKGDVVGSVEALVGVLTSRQPEQVGLNVVHSGVGAISESDVEMAASSGGIVVGFNVSYNKAVGSLARLRGVTLLTHNIIYKLLELLKCELESSLPDVWEEEELGEGVVLKVFSLTGKKAAVVGGCRVKQGKFVRSATFRLLRGGEVVHRGSVVGMKHGKDDIAEARKETECGITFSTDPGFREGDRVQCFTRKKVPQTLKWDLQF